MSLPIILEPTEAVGHTRDKTINVSTIAASSLILTCRGVDRILVPVPGNYERESSERGIELLPPERRGMVELIDKNGQVLERVRNYLEPLSTYASEWPETAFVSFIETFAYQVALATKYGAAIASDSASMMREFIPIIRPELFRGEAQFRLAELASIICNYEPQLLEHGSLKADADISSEMSPNLWRLIETSEFRAFVAANGTFGYIEQPIVGLSRLRAILMKFLRREDTSRWLKITGTVADVASKTYPKAAALKASTSLLSALTETGLPFSPPFLKLGPVAHGIYRASISSVYPDAVPPPKTLFVFQTDRVDGRSFSWLSVGEESKLEREAGDIAASRARYDSAQQALSRFL